jgi:hypothetical protein
MKNAIRFGFVTLVLSGILAASVTPQKAATVYADGTSPTPLCDPGNPRCKPPIPPQ